MPANNPTPKTPGQKRGWGTPALVISLACLGFIGWLVYDKRKETSSANTSAAQNTGLSQPVTNSIATANGTTPLTYLTPATTIQGATNDTEVYPVSVTDPNGLTIDDFNYGVSTSPQFQGQQGISYKEYEQLVG